MSDSLSRLFQVKPKELVFIKSLLEGYDNLAIMTTVDPKSGIFKLQFTEGLSEDLDMIMEGIKKEVELRAV